MKLKSSTVIVSLSLATESITSPELALRQISAIVAKCSQSVEVMASFAYSTLPKSVEHQ